LHRSVDAARLQNVNTLRASIVGLLIVTLPLSATASFAASLSCPHQGIGAVQSVHAAPHDHATMHHHAGMHATMQHDGDHAVGHHTCDCVHHCAGANPASAVPALAVDGLARSDRMRAVYQAFHTDSSESPLLRPPISAPSA
jgi:hypothetical protein